MASYWRLPNALRTGFVRQGKLTKGCSQTLSLRRLSYKSDGQFFRVSEEVRDALATKKPVVALETTIYTHGFPYPENADLAAKLERLCRENGAVPAHIGFLDGRAMVGMSDIEMMNLLNRANTGYETIKLSRRDISFVAGQSLSGRNINGGTTIAGTMVLAELAGIKVFATGGLGGVHKRGEDSMDISADLTELGRTPVAVVSSGCKSFLDIGRTLEVLETQGVGVCTFADGRSGTVDFPAFWTRNSGLPSPRTIKDEDEAAAIILAHHRLGLRSGLFFANPIAEQYSLNKEYMDEVMTQARKNADDAGATGHANTPHVLSQIRAITQGKTITANRELVLANVVRGAKVSRKLAELEALHGGGGVGGTHPDGRHSVRYARTNFDSRQQTRERQGTFGWGSFTEAGENGAVAAHEDRAWRGSEFETEEPSLLFKRRNSELGEHTPGSAKEYVEHEDALPKSEKELRLSEHQGIQGPELVVIGSAAMDLSCDIAESRDFIPATSNPTKIRETVGGVGRNIAVAAAYCGADTAFYTRVGRDTAGQRICEELNKIKYLRPTIHVSKSLPTARYVSLNSHENMHVAAADMSIFDYGFAGPEQGMAKSVQAQRRHQAVLAESSSKPQWLLVDANLPPSELTYWMKLGIASKVAFEPVSVAKAPRLIKALETLRKTKESSFKIDILTPNVLELEAIAEGIRNSTRGNAEWKLQQLMNTSTRKILSEAFLASNNGGIMSEAFSKSSDHIVAERVVEDAVELLDVSECVTVTLGRLGVLMLKTLPEDDPLRDTEHYRLYAIDIPAESTEHGPGRLQRSIYARYFPAHSQIDPESSAINVNGAGDTFTGVMLAFLSCGGRFTEDEIVPIAQKAATWTLRSPESVGPKLHFLKADRSSSGA